MVRAASGLDLDLEGLTGLRFLAVRLISKKIHGRSSYRGGEAAVAQLCSRWLVLMTQPRECDGVGGWKGQAGVPRQHRVGWVSSPC
jgi:hypothetical protein